jgi:hypothetical protein
MAFRIYRVTCYTNACMPVAIVLRAQLLFTNSLQLEYLRQAAKVAAGALACQQGKPVPVPFNFAQGCDMNNAMMNPAALPVELTVQEVDVVTGGNIGAEPPPPKLTGLVTIGEEPPPPKLTGLLAMDAIGAEPPPPK